MKRSTICTVHRNEIHVSLCDEANQQLRHLKRDISKDMLRRSRADTRQKSTWKKNTKVYNNANTRVSVEGLEVQLPLLVVRNQTQYSAPLSTIDFSKSDKAVHLHKVSDVINQFNDYNQEENKNFNVALRAPSVTIANKNKGAASTKSNRTKSKIIKLVLCNKI
ncbi:hypothetical protein H5410_033934 [Solanum commersonii]|uniref:Uncharacterized protein n=1 Tax=Solanum commersonii TaxID=4109 RepID=A0A9J5YU29_SOLCO|nr:hypothetical protein H5410_033934 [Solanum commersonii]